MSLSDEEIAKMIDKLDAGEHDGVSEEVKNDRSLIVKGINLMEEQKFKGALDSSHQTMKSSGGFNARYLWISGIAASLIGLFFLWNTNKSTSGTNFELQMEEAPAYADSASYDSLKNIDLPVDKSQEKE